MIKRLILLITISLFATSYAIADEVISTMDNAGLATLNEELRQSSSGLRTLQGQLSDLLPIDLTSTSEVSGALLIANGGTGATTAQTAIDALLPAQSGKSGYVLTTDGTNASWGAGVSQATAGDVIVYSYPTYTTCFESSYTLKKQVRSPRTGTIRVSFTLSVGGGDTGTVYGKIYVNGSAVGTERTQVNQGTSSAFIEDISVTAGDLVQIYGKQNSIDEAGGETCGFSNLTISETSSLLYVPQTD